MVSKSQLKRLAAQSDSVDRVERLESDLKDLVADVTLLRAVLKEERKNGAEPEFLIDTLAGKLTTFDQVVGYISDLERKVEKLEGR